MATGTGERPLGTPAQEKTLMGLYSGLKASYFSIASNVTRYLVFTSGEVITGVIFIGSTNNSKLSMYMISCNESSDIAVVPVFPATQSGFSVTASGRVITIVNKTGYAYPLVFQWRGTAPTLTTTAPT